MAASPRRHLPRSVLCSVLVAALVFVAVAAVGCGKDPQEEVLENILEQAMEESVSTDSGGGVDIDIDGDDGTGTITITGDDGQEVIQTGEDVALPEGFPKELVPDGATVMQAVTAEQAGVPMHMVTLKSATSPDDMYDHYLSILGDAGFTILNKAFIQSDADDDVMMIQAQDSGTVVSITGGGEESDGYVYVVQVQSGVR